MIVFYILKCYIWPVFYEVISTYSQCCKQMKECTVFKTNICKTNKDAFSCIKTSHFNHTANLCSFTGERMFPPQSGLTFSTWFCVDKYSVQGVDPHPVRLFTIVRNLQGREENLICLSITLSPRDKALYVCTQEVLMPNAGKESMI